MQQRRGPWSPLEDANLVSLVQRFGAHNWVRISQLVGTRSPKQCRERFHQNLKPQLNRDPITPEEGALIEQLVAEMGKRWAEIARRLKGRSDNAVKNWWNGGMNRRKRMCMRQKQTEAGRSVEQDRGYKPVSIEPMPHTSYVVSGSPQHSHHPALESRRHYVEPPLLSPPLSASMSRRGSKETTPALTLDSTSPNSASPRLPASPSMEVNLPPLVNSSNTRYSHQISQSQYVAQRYEAYQDRRRSLPHPLEDRRPPQVQQMDKSHPTSAHSHVQHHEHGGYLAQLAELSQTFKITEPKQLSGLPATPTNAKFPSLPATPLSPASSAKDQRMNLSSILL